MAGPRARLAILLVLLAAGFAVFWGFDVLDRDTVSDWVDGFGPFAPVAYVVISALLGMALVPGPVLAGVSGLLFGAALGTLVTLCASVVSAVGGLLVARHVGRAGVRDLAGDRLDPAERLLERHGTWAVVAQRLVPGVPDSPMSYAAGLVGITVAQIALGTAIGAAPRAFSYTALGASLDDPTSPVALVAVGVLVLVGLVGAEIARRVLRDHRRGRRARREEARGDDVRPRASP